VLVGTAAIRQALQQMIDSGAPQARADLWFSRVFHGDSNAVRNFLPSLRAVI